MEHLSLNRNSDDSHTVGSAKVACCAILNISLFLFSAEDSPASRNGLLRIHSDLSHFAGFPRRFDVFNSSGIIWTRKVPTFASSLGNGGLPALPISEIQIRTLPFSRKLFSSSDLVIAEVELVSNTTDWLCRLFLETEACWTGVLHITVTSFCSSMMAQPKLGHSRSRPTPNYPS